MAKKFRKRLRKAVKRVGRVAGKVISVGAPIAGGLLGGPGGAAIGTGVGALGGRLGTRGEGRRKALKRTLAVGGLAFGATGIAALATGRGFFESPFSTQLAEAGPATVGEKPEDRGFSFERDLEQGLNLAAERSVRGGEPVDVGALVGQVAQGAGAAFMRPPVPGEPKVGEVGIPGEGGFGFSGQPGLYGNAGSGDSAGNAGGGRPGPGVAIAAIAAIGLALAFG